MEMFAMTAENLKFTVQRKLAMAIENTKKLIEACLDAPQLRIDDKAFTRERALRAKKLLHLILHRVYHSLLRYNCALTNTLQKSTCPP
jgi:hypothetical protein